MSNTIGYDVLSMSTSLTKEEGETLLKKAAHYLAERVFAWSNDENAYPDEDESTNEASENYIDSAATLEEVEENILTNLQHQTTLEDNSLFIQTCSEADWSDGTLVDFTAKQFLPFMTTAYCEGISFYTDKHGNGGNTYFLDKEGEFHTASELAQKCLSF